MQNASSPRIENFQGDEYVVAPVVALRETVLPGSPVPGTQNTINARITSDAIRNSVPLWEGEILTIGHPTQNGLTGPAKAKENQERVAIGYFFNADIKGDKLIGEAWIHRRRASQSNPGQRILNDVQDGKVVENSTGYLADVIMLDEDGEPVLKTVNGNDRKAKGFDLGVPVEGIFNGQPYEGLQVNIRPDHNAILPYGEGKCSKEDGCGLNQNSSNSVYFMAENILETGRVPSFEGTVSADERDWLDGGPDLSDLIDGFLSNTDTDLTEDDLNANDWTDNPEEFRSWAAQLSILGDADSDEFSNGVLLPVVFPDTMDLSEDGLDSVLSTVQLVEGVSDQTKIAAEGIARNLLETEFGRNFDDTNNGGTEDMDKLQKIINQLKQFVENADPEDDTENQEVSQRQMAELVADWLNVSTGEAMEMAEENGGGEIALEDIVSIVADASDRGTDEAVEFLFGGEDDDEDDMDESENEDDDTDTTTNAGGENMAELSDEQIEVLGQYEPEELEGIIENAKQRQENEEAEAEELREELSENEQVPFGEDELEDKSLNELRKLDDMVSESKEGDDTDQGDTAQNYSGMGGFNGEYVNNSGDSDYDDEDFAPDNLVATNSDTEEDE